MTRTVPSGASRDLFESPVRHDVGGGGGQAGLAIGYLLAQQGRDFTIFEAADEPAAAWRRPWDSLRAPGGIPGERALVVGGGSTGFQIAEELSRSRGVHLSIGSRQTPLPQRILGRDLFWYLETTGLVRKTTNSRVGRRMQGRDTLIGSRPRTLCRRHGVRLHRRAAEAAGRTVVAAHRRLGADRLDQGRRRVPGAEDRRARAGGRRGCGRASRRWITTGD